MPDYFTIVYNGAMVMMMMMMMKLLILPCAEKLELVLSTAPKHEITPTKTVKTEKRSH